MKLSQYYINWEAEFTNPAWGFEITESGMPQVKKPILHLLPEAWQHEHPWDRSVKYSG